MNGCLPRHFEVEVKASIRFVLMALDEVEATREAYEIVGKKARLNLGTVTVPSIWPESVTVSEVVMEGTS